MKLLCISPLACWNFLFTGDSNQAMSCFNSSSVNFSSNDAPSVVGASLSARSRTGG